MSAVGKHAWVLRYAQVAELFRFLRAQRALSRALVALRRTDRVALDRRLRASHPAAWWALLLSYNAHRRDVGSGVDGERSLERPLPPEDTWRRAWRFALVLDPAVRAFLEIFFPEAGVAPTPLYVPRGF